MKRIIKLFSFLLFVVIITITGLLAGEWVLSRIVINKQQTPGDITVYLLSNGAHTDLVLPVKTAHNDWSEIFPYKHTKGQNATWQHIGIGWGDKGFYLETPTWADLKLSTAFYAIAGLSSAALHCTYMNEPKESDKCVKIKISAKQYQKLSTFILSSLKTDGQGFPQWIRTDAVYNDNDAFYEAKGKYNIVYTCNTWTNEALKKAEMKAALWLAFEKPLINIYKNN